MRIGAWFVDACDRLDRPENHPFLVRLLTRAVLCAHTSALNRGPAEAEAPLANDT